MKVSKRKKEMRKGFALPRPESICLNCGERGSHFAPPCLGNAGFFICKQVFNY